MDFNLTTPALLFPAISLLLLAYTNRFLTLAALIRELHARYRADPEDVLIPQIANLRYRVVLIRNMQMVCQHGSTGSSCASDERRFSLSG